MMFLDNLSFLDNLEATNWDRKSRVSSTSPWRLLDFKMGVQLSVKAA